MPNVIQPSSRRSRDSIAVLRSTYLWPTTAADAVLITRASGAVIRKCHTRSLARYSAPPTLHLMTTSAGQPERCLRASTSGLHRANRSNQHHAFGTVHFRRRFVRAAERRLCRAVDQLGDKPRRPTPEGIAESDSLDESTAELKPPTGDHVGRGRLRKNLRYKPTRVAPTQWMAARASATTLPGDSSRRGDSRRRGFG